MLAELENISYYVQAPGHNKRFPGHNSGGIINMLDIIYGFWLHYGLGRKNLKKTTNF